MIFKKDLKKWFDRSIDGFVDTDNYNYFHKNVAYAVDKCYNCFKKDAQKSVNYLVKQFEMKKSADEYKQSVATSKTGVIDTNKLFKYKLTDDIFKKVTVVPEGKNHGLVMYLDWSGSMQYQLLDTLKQTYNLIWFCRKANIPFRVYGFQSGLRPDQALLSITIGVLVLLSLRTSNFLSSSLLVRIDSPWMNLCD